ncbi:hypothetical protein HYU14_04085 [Candidatus Woesearchaeota archaeon]|nr:hypothetical protein [Candidatus Woesearchaeota archaeon]
MKYKNGQGLPLNVIVVALIVLVVLVVIWLIFTGKIGAFSKEVSRCEPRAKCMPRSQCSPNGAEWPEGTDSCRGAQPTATGGIVISAGDPICCIKI